ncbi:hypothetical protein MMC08_008118 [Hypocenomyce scalaris]|nr:hypothetical protein [Hypocenomyce scalaris]
MPHSVFPRSQFCDNVPAHKAGTPLNRRSIPVSRTAPFPASLDLNPNSIIGPTNFLSLTHLFPRDPTTPTSPPQPPTCAVSDSQNCPGSYLWCAYDSSTWVLTTFTLNLPLNPAAVQSLLSRSLALILAHIQQTTDGPVEGGVFGYAQAATNGGSDASTLVLAPDPAAGASDASTTIDGQTAYRVNPGGRHYPQPSIPEGMLLLAENADNHQITWGVLGAAIQAVLSLMAAQEWWGATTAVVYDGENEVGTLAVSVGSQPAAPPPD